MPSYLLTYDLKATVPDPRKIVHTQLQDAGWFSRLQKDGLSWAYPNTTMSGSFDTDADAQTAFRSAIRKAKTQAEQEGKGGVVIEKVYITRRTEVLFESNDKTVLES